MRQSNNRKAKRNSPDQMKAASFLFVLLALSATSQAQNTDPQLNSWWFNTNNETTNGALVDVEAVHFNSDFVYVMASGVPSYYQQGQNVFLAHDMGYTFRLPRYPAPALGNNLATLDNGAIAVLADGSVAAAGTNGKTWQNQGEWHELAYEHDVFSLDQANGSVTSNNQYLHRVDPALLYTLDEGAHSPIIGFAFDGFPIYGPMGYANADGTGAAARMTSSYQVRNITSRTELPGGNPSEGPAIDKKHPLGSYREDYEFVEGSGTLDAHNGRFCITPEYPDGTYAYFVTVDEFYEPVYPYMIGESFFGEVETGNMGVGGADFDIPETASEFVPGPSGTPATASMPDVAVFPNPAENEVSVQLRTQEPVTLTLLDVEGRMHYSSIVNGRSSGTYTIPMEHLTKGTYFLRIESDTASQTETVMKL